MTRKKKVQFYNNKKQLRMYNIDFKRGFYLFALNFELIYNLKLDSEDK